MTKIIKTIGVFCGAKLGNRPEYLEATQQFAKLLVQRNISVVYGGGRVGLMQVLADQILKLGGEVIGVIPETLVAKEVAHLDLSKLHIVPSMHERKLLIANLSDGFVLLPGGAGSLDEFFEMFTLMQLGYQNKSCAILNAANYYNHLIQFLNYSTEEGFIARTQRNQIIIENSPEKLLQKMMH